MRGGSCIDLHAHEGAASTRMHTLLASPRSPSKLRPMHALRPPNAIMVMPSMAITRASAAIGICCKQHVAWFAEKPSKKP